MIYVLYAVVALAGAAIHRWRHPGERGRVQLLETVLLWWIVVTIGVAGIVGGLFHLFDGAHIAKEIGFTRGDGGFQTEVGFGDLALGVAVNDNHDPDNTGAVLYADILVPLVGLALYAALERLRRSVISPAR